MSEMIERACRSVATARGYDPDAPVLPGIAPIGPDGCVMVWREPIPLWMTFIRDVRATMEAMREPTEDMVDAGCMDDGRGSDIDARLAGKVYRGMLAAALISPEAKA